MRRTLIFTAMFCLLLGAASLDGCSQTASRAESSMPAAGTIEWIGPWGVRGEGPGQLQDPVSIATDALGNVYIVDAGSRFIHKFDPQGKPLLSFQEDPIKHPRWVTVGRGEAIYVSDPVRSSVFICFPTGVRDHFQELRLRTRSRKDNQLSIGVEDDGLVYVFDANAAKVYTFNSRMRLVAAWNPSVHPPDGKIFPGPMELGPDGNFYIADGAAGTILKFTPEKTLVAEIRLRADGANGKLSSQFAVSRGNIFAMDVDGRMLHVFTLDGVPKLDKDLAPELGQAARPAPPLAVSPRGELLVLDGPESRVLRFRINF